MFVMGSNGGRLQINADGSVDFDAAGHFDFLKGGETATTTFTYEIRDSFEVEPPKQNILFVIDISGSTDARFQGTPVGDLNEDGLTNTVLDAQIAALTELSEKIAALGLDATKVDLGVIAFSGSRTDLTDPDSGSIEDDAQLIGTFKPGDAALPEALRSLRDGGFTNFESALSEAADWYGSLGATRDDNNVLFFLSDGKDNTGTGTGYDDDVAVLENDYAVQSVAIGLGSGASLGQLNRIDNTDGAEIVLSTDALSTEVLEGFEDTVSLSDTGTVTVTVVGVPEIAANDDALTVFQTESTGDREVLADGSETILENDFSDDTAFGGEVLSINGVPIASGGSTSVAGSNAGRATIYSDGQIDFDAEGAFDWLAVGESDTTRFVYEIDGEATAEIVVTIEGTNDAPTAGHGLFAEVTQDHARTGINLLEGASDIDLSDVLSVRNVAAITADNHTDVIASIEGNVVTLDPESYRILAEGETVGITFEYEVVDPHGAADQGSYEVVLVGVNDAPVVAMPLTLSVTDAMETVMIDLLDGVSDLDNNAVFGVADLTVSVDGFDTAGSYSIDGSMLSFNPDTFESLSSGESVDVLFAYKIRDEFGASVDQTLTIRVDGTDQDAAGGDPVLFMVHVDTRPITSWDDLG
jgi:VCBS repeat-containing protein